MKFSILPLIALAISQVAATPAPNPIADAVSDAEPTVYNPPAEFDLDIRALEKRAVSGTVVVDGLRYRTCPRTSCAAIGQYAKGTKISINCYTRTDTTVVDGDAGWAKLTNGYYVAMAFGHYISWSAPIPAC